MSGYMLSVGFVSVIVDYELVRGNALWRFALVVVTMAAAMAVGRTVQFLISKYVSQQKKAGATNIFGLVLAAIEKPVYVVLLVLGLDLCRSFLYFDAEKGINPAVLTWWVNVMKVVYAVAGVYVLYRLVDVVDYYLMRVVSRTENRLDDMLVPVVRKSIRVTITLIGFLYVAEITNITDDLRSILVGAGIGGVAIALAARETIANFFGSLTIFADRPFQIGELVRIEGHFGPVVEVGFRSTRVRTLDGHLVTIPNSIVANAVVENVGRRPFIRRKSNITITYDSGAEKANRAVEIIKEILAGIPEINTDGDKPFRVYFSQFNDCSLNIYMSYWVRPADYWLYHEVNQRVNLEVMRRFEQAGIEFAFPTQTLYLKGR